MLRIKGFERFPIVCVASLQLVPVLKHVYILQPIIVGVNIVVGAAFP